MKRLGILALCAALGGCDPGPVLPPAKPIPTSPTTLTVPPAGERYTGAYIEFGDHEDDVTLEKIERFEALAGRHTAIIASSSYWGEQSFPAANVRLIFQHGSIPLLFWSPWDRPYTERPDRPDAAPPDQYSLTNILAGKWDAYLDAWGDGAKAFGQPLFVSFGNEMNGTWFPWSGKFYGGGQVVPGSSPRRYQGPETYKAAYRYVVDRVRARGATNVLWVFHPMNAVAPAEEWNKIANYYPGANYVDWLGMSVYGQQAFYNEDWSPFTPLVTYHYVDDDDHQVYDGPYEQLCALDPQKPIMLTEWGVGEFPKSMVEAVRKTITPTPTPAKGTETNDINPKSGGDKAAFFTEAFALMKTLPRLKAAIYWHERWQNDTGDYSNLHINSSPEALEAYRRGIADPSWRADPILQPK